VNEHGQDGHATDEILGIPLWQRRCAGQAQEEMMNGEL